MNAPDRAVEIKAVVTGAIAFVTALIGWVGWLVVVWIFAMLLDYLTGTLAAVSSGTWSSTIARQGLWHKLGSIAAMLVAAGLDIALGVIIPGMGIDYDFVVLTPVVALWYILTETGSIIENADKLGAPIPEFLRKAIKKTRDKIESTDSDKTEKM